MYTVFKITQGFGEIFLSEAFTVYKISLKNGDKCDIILLEPRIQFTELK